MLHTKNWHLLVKLHYWVAHALRCIQVWSCYWNNKTTLVRSDDVQNRAHAYNRSSSSSIYRNQIIINIFFNTTGCSRREKFVAIILIVISETINVTRLISCSIWYCAAHDIKILLIIYEFEKLARSGPPVVLRALSSITRVIFIGIRIIFRSRSSRPVFGLPAHTGTNKITQ